MVDHFPAVAAPADKTGLSCMNPYEPPKSDAMPVSLKLACGLIRGLDGADSLRTTSAEFRADSATVVATVEPAGLRRGTLIVSIGFMAAVIYFESPIFLLLTPLVHVAIYAAALSRVGFKTVVPLSSHRLYYDAATRCFGFTGLRQGIRVFLGFRAASPEELQEICGTARDSEAQSLSDDGPRFRLLLLLVLASLLILLYRTFP